APMLSRILREGIPWRCGRAGFAALRPIRWARSPSTFLVQPRRRLHASYGSASGATGSRIRSRPSSSSRTALPSSIIAADSSQLTAPRRHRWRARWCRTPSRPTPKRGGRTRTWSWSTATAPSGTRTRWYKPPAHVDALATRRPLGASDHAQRHPGSGRAGSHASEARTWPADARQVQERRVTATTARSRRGDTAHGSRRAALERRAHALLPSVPQTLALDPSITNHQLKTPSVRTDIVLPAASRLSFAGDGQ